MIYLFLNTGKYYFFFKNTNFLFQTEIHIIKQSNNRPKNSLTKNELINKINFFLNQNVILIRIILTKVRINSILQEKQRMERNTWKLLKKKSTRQDTIFVIKAHVILVIFRSGYG